MSGLNRFFTRFRFSTHQAGKSRNFDKTRLIPILRNGLFLTIGGFVLYKTAVMKNTVNTIKLHLPAETPAPKDVEVFKTKADLKDGEKRAFQIGPKEEDAVLIIKQDGQYYCIQDKCAHFGFSLAKGMLFGEKIVCPLHNATFSIKSGLPETGPVFDGVQTYKITENEGQLTIEIPKGLLNKNKVLPMATRDPTDHYSIVVIGGGPAALSAAETLRQAGYTGSLTLISKDQNLPYDRTLLSKNFNANPEGTVVRKRSFLENYGIDVHTSTSVKKINYENKEVQLTNGQKVSYDSLLIATGTAPVVPPIPGANDIQQFTLRSHRDLENIRSTIVNNKLKNITIIGGGFIGLELSSALKLELKDKVNITILESQNTPLERILGPEIGKSIENFVQKNGVHIETSAKIKEIKSGQGKVESVELETKSIPTDVVIFATGVKPVTDFVGNLELDETNGGIKTDSFLKTSQKNVYAAGDVASFPYWLTAKNTRIEHYNQAIYQGSIAALNMIGKHRPVDHVPFFWTRFFNSSVQYTGNTKSWDEVIVKGDVKQMKFVAYYIKKGKVVAAAAMNSLNSIMTINEALNQGVMPTADQIRKNDFNLDVVTEAVKLKSPLCDKCKNLTAGFAQQA